MKAEKRALDVTVYAIGMLLQQAVTFGSGIVVAHWLGPGGYGATSLVRNIFAVALILAPLGLDLAILRHVNERGGGSPSVVSQINGMRAFTFCVSMSITVLIAVIGAPWLSEHVYRLPDMHALLILTFIAFPFAADTAILGAAMRSFRLPIFQNIANLYIQPILRLALLVGLLWCGLGARGVVLATAVAAMGTTLILQRAFLRTTRQNGWSGHKRQQTDRDEVRKVFSYSLWLAVTLLIYGLLRSLDILVVGRFCSPAEIGSYAVMATVAQTLMVLPQSVSQTIGPKISEYYHAAQYDRMRELMTSYVREAILLTSILFGGVAAFGPWLHLIFGRGFVISPSLSLALAIMYLISGLFAPMGYSLSMTGNHRKELVILIIGGLIAASSCILLTSMFGLVGAAVGVLLGYGFIDLTRTVIVSRMMNFIPGRLGDLLPPVFCLGLGCLVRSAGETFFNVNLWSAIPLGLSYVGVAVIFYWKALLSHDEKEKVAATVMKKLGRRLPLARGAA